MSMRTTDQSPTGRPLAAALIALGIAAIAAMIVAVTPAAAAPQIDEFAVGTSNTQAGAHPDLTARFRIGNAGEPEVVKNVTVNFPEGVFGNPGAIFRCRSDDFIINECQAGAQAGLITIVANYEGNPNTVLGTAPIYNLSTVGDETARLGFVVPTVNVPVAMPIDVRSESDYGLRMSINSISQTVALGFASMTIWGFPADEAHDPDRFPRGGPGNPPGCPGSSVVDCLEPPFPRAGLVVMPFIDNPSVCTGEELPVVITASSYQDPTPASATAFYPETTGCENQKFDPAFNFGLTTGSADAPSGLDIRLRAAQFLAGDAPSQSILRSAEITLPDGLTINPDAADGQTACLQSQARFGTNLPAACPDTSKIGTVEVNTPALDGPLPGSLFIGEPLPGQQYRVFMVFDGYGVHAKLAVGIEPDPLTGQLTMRVVDLPQVPFEEFNLHLFASDRGLLATPTHCRLYQGNATLVAWNDTLAPQHSSPIVSIDSGPNGRQCPDQIRPFAPRLAAGTTNSLAGDFSSFSLKLDRDDGDQYLGDLNFRLPPGFTGSLRGISYCPEASIVAAAARPGRDELAAPSCPASSQVGTTNVSAGPGSAPFNAVGRMYLAGPLKGAPLSLAAITPALAGPYDYGTQVVRVALHVDPRSAQVYAASERMPQIIGGVPLRMRSIRVNIDRPNFTINPTNCAPMSVESQGIGDQGTVTNFSSYFQAVNCATLPFKPRMAVRQLGGKGQTKRAKNPRLRFDLRTRAGDANIKSVAVTLPKSFAIDQRHLGNICSKAQLESENCAGRQPMGHVWVKTPLLDEPLKGPAYAVSGFGKLPRLAFLLDGQVRLVPQAESAARKDGRLRTVVPIVPDAPIGHFRLTLLGGKRGYLVNTRDLCAGTSRITVQYTAQNGRRLTQKPKAQTPCGKRAKKSSKKSR